ncbi:Mediator of replication checkpoint protein 1 [Pleurostoma richardsiae]|uniref:Mediator of replication checkpoint protein 1 n=1 Tax=Pleurostoma richardsiae TaxID=41990 RepID=A0AA38VPQ9_9PEZI|nr:Mediator of replication checkpoint protein 1 [Pleurostoma richardsiae]
MASSRSSSPSSPGSLGAFDLSPAAKVRAVLAQVDSDSDEGETRRPAKNLDNPVENPDVNITRIEASSSNSTAEDDNDDDDEDIIRPRGRLAAAMRTDNGTTHDADPEPEADARERVRRMLQLDALKEKSSEDTPDTDMNDVDKDEVLPVKKRRLQNRSHRSTTPEAAALASEERSPGLFVSPYKPDSPTGQGHGDDGSESELDLPSLKNNRFKELLAKKRRERQAREAEEARKQEARAAAQATAMGDLAHDTDEDVSDITDDEGGRKLTQDNARPARKASKKALEEMNRETQRMTRALQLAHEAKTKKKITKSTLFERFNFKPSGTQLGSKAASSSRPTSPASAQHSDAEMHDIDTPPSSPPALVEDVLGKDKTSVTAQPQAGKAQTALDNILKANDQDLLTLESALTAASTERLKKATSPNLDAKNIKPTVPRRNIRVRFPEIQANRAVIELDDDLDVAATKKSKLDAIFDRIPVNKAKESRSLHALRRLAHLDSPEKKVNKKIDKSAITTGELIAQLQQRARQQAKLERDRRLEMLRAKGVHIQTEEEREREMVEVEDIVARARREAEEIMQREKEAAKKEKKKSGEADPLAWDDSSDDEYQEEAELSEVELSGSDEEGEEEAAGSDVGADDEADVVPKEEPATEAMLDDEAESDGSESEQEWEDPDAEEERHRWGASDDEARQDESGSETEEEPVPKKPRRQKKLTVVLSDDEENEVEATPRPKNLFAKSPAANGTSPEVPTSVLRSATKTFIPGLPVAGPAGLGLTQIFAGTMDDSQLPPASYSSQVFMPSFDNFPDSQFSQTAEDSGNGMVVDSQLPDTQQGTLQERETQTQGVQINFSQSQMHGFDSLLQATGTQVSEMVELSQDAGFQNFTPLKERFIEAPASTIDTVIMHQTQPTQPIEEQHHDSPLVRKKSRLRRKILVASDSEDEAGGDMELEDDEFAFGTTAFSVMKEAAAKEKRRKAREEFNKKKSKAKEMVEEQAEESEDEYAGLGGADGEDSSDDDAASVHEMIDDVTQGNGMDDAKLAAFYADRERANDEKQVEKLFRDITSGMLRRKRGADYDLSDSDDGGEARRRMKRRQFAKMQKALFADERISKVAENPRNQAFLRTIEDRGSDDEMDFIFEPAPPAPEDSQESSPSQEKAIIPDSQPSGGSSAKLHNSGPIGNRPPAASRRTKTDKKPASLDEIRESLSNLLEEPSNNTIISSTDLGSDSENEDDGEDQPRGSDKENANPRRGRHAPVEVVDRISLKRNSSSSSSSTTGGGNGQLAFAVPSASASGFKVPALLRRATTNSLMSSSTSSSTGQGGAGAGASSGGGFGEEGKIKKSAGKRSGINYFARETERRAAVAESEKRREAKKWKGAEGRVKVVGGLFGAGKFE